VVESFGKMSKIKGRERKEAEMEKHKQAEDRQGINSDLIEGLNKWREKHPRATMREIEEEIDRRMTEMRARLIANTVMKSASPEMKKGKKEMCPKCGGEVKKKGKKKRKLETNGGQAIEFEREYVTCQSCGHVFFPS
jgi:YgiT-type zinc finger domain-containing protein